MVKLPLEISPSPLISTTVELRFESKQSINQLVPIVLSKFLGELPILTTNNIPNEIKLQDPNLRFVPDYTLKNDDFSISFSDKVLNFENVSTYKLWDNYFSFIKNNLQKFYELGTIITVKRIGVRYRSIFNGTYSLSDIVKTVPSIPLEGYIDTERGRNFRTVLKISDVILHLNMADNAKAKKNESEFNGAYIDIDASLQNDFRDPNIILHKINQLHQEQKKLFFTLLREDFLNGLNPRY